MRERLANKTHGLEGWAHFRIEVAGEHLRARRILAFGGHGHATSQRLLKRARVELRLCLLNGVGTGHGVGPGMALVSGRCETGYK